jgi:GWxTD domain-containing protein
MKGIRLAVSPLPLAILWALGAASGQESRGIPAVYRRWVEQDAAYLITDAERCVFQGLQTDAERDRFIEQFWARRNPHPESTSNEFEDEHYRRMAYANDRFASTVAGWKTDRGRVYILYGPPDQVEDHSHGVGLAFDTFPYLIWRYRYIEGRGTQAVEFADTTFTGDFRGEMNPKGMALTVPGTEPTAANGCGGESGRVTKGRDLAEEFSLITQGFAFVDNRHTVIDFKVHTDFFPVSETTVQVNITFQFDQTDKTPLHTYGMVTTMPRRFVSGFVGEDAIARPATEPVTYQQSLYLRPGAYRLGMYARDVADTAVGHFEGKITVPQLDPTKPSTSSLVLADQVETVPMNYPSRVFVVGSSKVRPRVGGIFKASEALWMFLKAYHVPEGTAHYEIVRDGAGDAVLDQSEALQATPQETLQKRVSLEKMTPGQYTARVRILDAKGVAVCAAAEARFTVE